MISELVHAKLLETICIPFRESGVTAKVPLIRTKSDGVCITNSPKMQRAAHGTADISDIHICVLCLKALMNNAVSDVWAYGVLSDVDA